MRADDIAPLFEQSQIVRAAARTGRLLHAAARSSATAAIVARARRHVDALAPATVVRLAGVVLLTATVTQRALVQLIPAQLRPAPPIVLYVWLAAAGLVLVGAAPAIVRAWPASRVYRRFMQHRR